MKSHAFFLFPLLTSLSIRNDVDVAVNNPSEHRRWADEQKEQNEIAAHHGLHFLLLPLFHVRVVDAAVLFISFI